MKIYSANGNEIEDIAVSDDSYRYRAIMGENSLTLTFSLIKFLDIPVGSYAEFQGERYTLLRPQNFKKNNTRDFEYTLILESAKSLLGRYKFRDKTSNRLKFSNTVKPLAHIEMLVWNLNQRDSGWAVGDCIEATEKVVAFNHTGCDEALKMIAEAFNTEYEVVGKVISLKKIEYNKSISDALPLSYGFGNGFKSGVKRDNYDNSKAIEVLYVQGGERNIDASKYKSSELLLPKGQTIAYEGRSYVVDDLGLSIRRADKPLSSNIEDSLDLSNIYPKRIGTVSNVVIKDGLCDFYDIENTVDFSKYVIAGEKATVIFQTGMLAGKEFDIATDTNGNLTGYVHKEKRFMLVSQEIDGVTMPSDTWKPSIGDTYAVFGITMPDEYVCDNTNKVGASWEMFREAVKYFYENEDNRFTFTGPLDGVWAKKNWLSIGGKIKLGGYVAFRDNQFQSEPVLIRIIGLKDYINAPHSPEIELSNVTVGGNTLSGELKKIATNEVVAKGDNVNAVRFAKRGFRDVRETTGLIKSSLLENFTNSVNPLTVQTMQLVVGDDSLQFVFVNSKTAPVEVTHKIEYDKKTKVFSSQAGIIQHMTLGITTLSSSHATSKYKFWDMPAYSSPYLDTPTSPYFFYAKVSKSNQTGEFVLSPTPKKIEEEAGFYHLLVATLNSEFDGDRSYVRMYGYSELTPARLTISEVASPDGKTFFKFNPDGSGVIGGNIKFISSGEYKDVDTAITEVSSKVNYTVEILSVQGNIFKNGIISTMLSARVFHGGDDITDTLNENLFQWTRKSANELEDSLWNTAHFGGTKSIEVTKNDVWQKATFSCAVNI